MIVESARSVIRIAQSEEITFLAAAIAYYAFVSVLPALLLVLVVASVLGGDRLAEAALAISGEVLTPGGEGILIDTIRNVQGRTGATLVGLTVLAWSALRLFRGLDIAFSRIYGTTAAETFLGSVRDAVVVALTIGLGIAVMAVVGTVIALVGGRGALLGAAALLLGLFVVFLPLYYLLPDTEISLREAVPGTAFAAIGWLFLQALFQIYASAAPRYELYGVIGGILLLVTWFYVAAILLLLGAAVNAVLSDRTDRQLQQAGSRGE